jgi:hypothetical protein
MKRLFAMISPRWRKLFRFAAWGVFIVLVLACLPSLFGFFVQALVWFSGLFHRSDDLWKECPWCF